MRGCERERVCVSECEKSVCGCARERVCCVCVNMGERDASVCVCVNDVGV